MSEEKHDHEKQPEGKVRPRIEEILREQVEAEQLPKRVADRVAELFAGIDGQVLDAIFDTHDRLLASSFDLYNREGLRPRKRPPVVEGLEEMQADIADYTPWEGGKVTLRGAQEVREFLHDLPDFVIEEHLEERGMYNTPLVVELQRLLNRHSAENSSNTPDYVLAEYLMGCLEAFNKGVLARAVYYGDDQHVGGP